MAKKVAKKPVKKLAPKSEVDVKKLEARVAKLEAYLKAQVDIKSMGGEMFANYPDL